MSQALPPPDLSAEPTLLDVQPSLTTDELEHFDPNWCLFWGKRVGSSQLDVWLPYLQRSRNRYVIMATSGIREGDRDKIAPLPNVIFVEPSERALDWLKRSHHFQGFLYVSTQPENFLSVNQQRRKMHVFIGHGESGKAGSGLRTGSLYDSILVADYGTLRRFPRAIRRWVASGACATGAPVVEGTRRDPWTRPRTVRTILYAPTWESGRERGDYTSVEVVAPVLIDLLPSLAARGIEVIVRPHPWMGARLPELQTLLAELVAAGASSDVSKADAFERADVLISDVSGVTAEFLLTQKPSIMPVTSKLAERGRDTRWLDLEYPWVYPWDTNETDLLTLLATIESSDPKRRRRAVEARRKFRHHRSLDDAVRTFDIALSVINWRKTPIPVRIPFEVKVLLARLRSRTTRVG